jgi:hypothetical protein
MPDQNLTPKQKTKVLDPAKELSNRLIERVNQLLSPRPNLPTKHEREPTGQNAGSPLLLLT